MSVKMESMIFNILLRGVSSHHQHRRDTQQIPLQDVDFMLKYRKRDGSRILSLRLYH
jgi:hypothetical protein